ncbi:MAG: UDP-N-acetylmuramoyl-L-alanine--D-glutamate ligase [Tissierellia bacterium]|nr:UDP-N-acetylmuramoyl-L-alanine--D-glutamate ligase [Tissierellia bacterium]
MDLLMGLGKTGKSLIQYYEKKGLPFILYDGNKELLASYKNKGYSVLDVANIHMDSIEMAVKSPGIPPQDEVVMVCNENNIPVLSDIGFFYREVKPKECIAITGTNGKTTVTKMIGDILKKFDPIIAGNVGTPVMECVSQEEKLYVLELSSYQLEHSGSLKPSIALILNIEEDHLSWHQSFANYKKAKYNIVRNQDSNDYVILNMDDPNCREISSKSNQLFFSMDEKKGAHAYVSGGLIEVRNGTSTYSIPIEKLPYQEKHNIQNYMAAFLVASIYGLPLSEVWKMIERFRLDPHRMEQVGVVRGRIIIDDSKATNPSATISALQSVEKSTILLLGGFDKGTRMDELLKLANEKTKKMIFFGGIGKKLASLAKEMNLEYELCSTLEDAAHKAMEISSLGDSILLSPGASSFDEFQSYEHRGMEFRRYIGVGNEEA